MHFALFLLQQQPSPEQLEHIMMAAVPIICLIVVVIYAVIIVPFWFICKKAGFSPWLALLNLVPFGTLILLYVIAFAEWKVAPLPPQGWASAPPPPPGTAKF